MARLLVAFVFTGLVLFVLLRPKPVQKPYSAVVRTLLNRAPFEDLEIPIQFGGGTRETYYIEGDYDDIVASSKKELSALEALSLDEKEGRATIFMGDGVEIHVYEGRATPVSEMISKIKADPRKIPVRSEAYDMVNVDIKDKRMLSVVVLERKPNALKGILAGAVNASSGGVPNKIGK